MEPGGETICAHGTPYYYWVRPGTLNKLLIYFEGGGGCWDAETCRAGSTFYNDAIIPLDSPRNRSGIFDFANPDNPFKDYAFIYIPVCTGDVYTGDIVQTYPFASGEEITIHHKGFVNARAALEWVFDNVAAPESIFVTGCSAGSVGSAVFAPYIIDHYRDTALTQLGDSLAFVFHRPLNLSDYNSYANFASWIPALTALQPGEFTMARYYSAVAGYYPDHIFAQYNSAFDSVQIRFFVAVGGSQDGFNPALQASLNEIHTNASNFRSYTAGGALHCITPSPQFYTYETDGMRFSDWVADLALGRKVESVTCEPCDTP